MRTDQALKADADRDVRYFASPHEDEMLTKTDYYEDSVSTFEWKTEGL